MGLGPQHQPWAWLRKQVWAGKRRSPAEASSALQPHPPASQVTSLGLGVQLMKWEVIVPASQNQAVASAGDPGRAVQ